MPNHLTRKKLSARYLISPTTVTNYIRRAEQGKNDLKLEEYNGKKYILDTEASHFEIQKLVEKGYKLKYD